MSKERQTKRYLTPEQTAERLDSACRGRQSDDLLLVNASGVILDQDIIRADIRALLKERADMRTVISTTRVLLVKVADMLGPDADCLRIEISNMLAAFNELDGVPPTVRRRQ